MECEQSFENCVGILGTNERFPYLIDLSTDNESVTKLKIIHTCTPKGPFINYVVRPSSLGGRGVAPKYNLLNQTK